MTDVNKFLEQSIAGKPQVKATERAQYLGQLKERLYLAATFQDLNDPNFNTNLTSILKNKAATLYLSSQMQQSHQNDLIQLSLKYNRQFTIITKSANYHPTDIALVYAAKEAVHIPNCTYSVQFPRTTATSQVEKSKNKWWQKLFK